MESAELKKKVDKLWKEGKKEVDKVLRDTQKLAKKGEIRIKKEYDKAEKKLEVLFLSLQKERLYHELGKSLSRMNKKKWPGSKKIKSLLGKIKEKQLNISKIKRR